MPDPRPAPLPSLLPRQTTFLGHPLGLYVLFFTEMWERFSYYGMRALLILYMVNYFRWAPKDAATIYKVYTSFVYVTPIIGGYLADRYLGNRAAVIIGAILMAIGHFLMAFEEFPIFMSALIFLILGNGMFKPNMSTQVGRLYPTNDGRRDAAYTIFYMGINLGAFLSPLACGWLADNTLGGYHSGFTLAGIGMVLGLVIYLVGQPFLLEIDPSIVVDAPAKAGASSVPEDKPLTEAEAAKTPSVFGGLSVLFPPLLLVLGVGLIVAGPVYYLLQYSAASPEARPDPAWAVWTFAPFYDAIMFPIGGVSLIVISSVTLQIRNALRDRVLAILALGVFVMFFWAAFEQAGNVQNLWADKNTNRYLWQEMKEPKFEAELASLTISKDGEGPRSAGLWERFSTMFILKPSEAKGEETWTEWAGKSFNPIPTAWFQSINALAIFVIAPLFAWLWIWLDKRGAQPSIAMKMFLGLVFMTLSVVIMIGAAREEDKLTKTRFDGPLPAGITSKAGVLGVTGEKDHFEPFHAGRFTFADGTLSVMGVLPDNEYERIVGKTAPAEFAAKVEELAEQAKKIDGKNVKSASVVLASAPNQFAEWMARKQNTVVQYDPGTRTLTTYVPIKEKEALALRFFAGDPNFSEVVGRLFKESGKFRVSSWWLFWSFILATLGELCLSPVGLSMVSKLAPEKFATMLMGVWLLTSAFGNFAAGLAGEYWGTIPPVPFFMYLSAIVAGAAFVLLLLVGLINRTMHGVK